ncbi:MAG: T9SS type A sorting domain-containing protein [Candidatus Krumholzibacteriota bacterium]|nr:T9SS type A sorting domain-containing protein [Candidatus Krumholzibacteriota bacterium]
MRMIFKAAGLLCLALSLGLPSPGMAQWIKDGVPIAALANMQNVTDMISDGAGGAYVVWRDYRNIGNADVYMQRIDSYGFPLWADGGIAVAEGPSQQGDPVICMKDGGNVVVAYRDNVNGNDDIFAQCVDPDGNILWASTGMPVCLHSSYQGAPRIAAGTSGYMYIGWVDSRNGNQDVFIQRINWNGVTQWAADGFVVCNAAQVQDGLQMIADGSGGVTMVWEDYRDATNLLIYAQKVSSTGFVQWTANGVRLSTSNSWQNLPKLITDSSGGAIVVWYDDRNGVDTDIYSQRILSNGNTYWLPSGRSICTATGGQYFPDLTTDGGGGAIITWQDQRIPAYYHVYAQRVNASGNAQWTTNGLPLSDYTGGQRTPCIVSDGVGGAIIAWKDQRQGSEYDIHAQRIDAAGSKMWATEGERVSGAINHQVTAMITTDGAQGAIITWNDLRYEDSNDYDVYAQRMEKWGHWGYPAPMLTGAADVPNDQGGRVMLTWDASYLDAYPTEIVTHYSIWRSTDGATYTQIDSMDAYYLDSYQYAASTTADSSALGDATHWFKIRARTSSSLFWWTSQPLSCHSVDNLSPSMPTGAYLEQNFPNPMNPVTIIKFGLDAPEFVSLRIYDAAGRLVRELVNGPMPAGYHDKLWDGRTDGGVLAASGVYFYKLSAGEYTETKKMVLLR